MYLCLLKKINNCELVNIYIPNFFSLGCRTHTHREYVLDSTDHIAIFMIGVSIDPSIGNPNSVSDCITLLSWRTRAVRLWPGFLYKFPLPSCMALASLPFTTFGFNDSWLSLLVGLFGYTPGLPRHYTVSIP